MSQIAGIVLSGGRSSRFGTDKAVAELDGQMMLSHVVHRLSPQVDALALAGSSHGLPYPGLSDEPFTGYGPLAGVHAGLVWAEKMGAVWLACAPCDTPRLPRNLVTLLLQQAVAGRAVAIQVEDRWEAACALWPVDARSNVEGILRSAKRKSLHHALHELDAVTVHVAATDLDGSFANINTADDLKLLQQG